MVARKYVLEALDSFLSLRRTWLKQMISDQGLTKPEMIVTFAVTSDFTGEIAAEIRLAEKVVQYLHDEPYNIELVITAAQTIQHGFTANQILKAISSVIYYVKGNS